MKTILLFVLICACAVMAEAQKLQGKARLDSLLTELPNAKPDTNRMMLLFSIVNFYTSANPDSGLVYLNEAVALSGQLNWNRSKGLIALYGGMLLKNKGNFQEAIQVFQNGLEEIGINGHWLDRSRLLMNIGISKYFMADYPEALNLYFQALKLAEEHKGDEMKAPIYTNMASVYTVLHQYPKAIDYYLKVLQYYEARNSKTHQAIVLGNLGQLYTHLKHYQMGLDYHFRALKIDEELKMNRHTAFDLLGIGIAYMALNEYSSALEYNLRALKIFESLGEKNGTAICQTSIGKIYLHAANNPQPSVAVAPFDISRQKRLQLARSYLESGLSELQETKDLETIKSASLSLSQVHQLLGNPQAAFDTYKLHIATRDSIESQENKSKIIRLEAKRETDLKQKELELKQKELQIKDLKLQKAESHRWYLAGGLALLMLLLGALFNRFRLKQRKNQELEEAYHNLELVQHELMQKEKSLFAKQLLETELKALRAQMNPHFIFNCLNSIQHFIMRQDRIIASDYLQKFSRLIRLILDNSQKASTSLEDEAEILTLYLDLERLRMRNKFDYEIDIPDDIEPGLTEFPSMVIQPLVENSIWHGLMPAEGPGHLRISFRRTESGLTCVIEDNGIGWQQSQQRKGQQNHESKGLKLIQDRLTAWSQTHEYECEVRRLDATEYSSGTRTEITISYAPETVLQYA